MKFIFVLFTSLFLCFKLNAQDSLRVVKDFNSCQYGLKNKNDKWVIEPIYDWAEELEFGFLVSTNQKFGVLNKSAQLQIPLAYGNLNPLKTQPHGRLNQNLPFFLFPDTSRWYLNGLLSLTGDTIFPPIYQWEQLNDLYETIYVIKDSARFGFLNSSLNFISSIKTGWIDQFDKKHLAVFSENINDSLRLYGLMTRNGEVLSEAIYNNIKIIDNLAIVKQSDYYGVLSLITGKLICPIEFQQIEIDKEHGNLVLTKKNNLYGLYNSSGKELSSPCYISLKYIANKNIFLTQSESGHGLYEFENDKELLQPNFKILLSARDILFIKDTLSWVYKPIDLFSNNYFLSKPENEFYLTTEGVVDKKGKLIMADSNYKSIQKFGENHIYLTGKNGSQELFNTNNKSRELLPRHNAYSDFLEDINGFWISSEPIDTNQNGRFKLYSIVNKKILTQFWFDRPVRFENGIAIVGRNDQFGLLNKNGFLLDYCKYKKIIKATKNLFWAQNEEQKWGLISNNKSMEYSPKWSKISANIAGYTQVTDSDKVGLIDQKGQLIIKPTTNTLANYQGSLKEKIFHMRAGGNEFMFSEELTDLYPASPENILSKVNHLLGSVYLFANENTETKKRANNAMVSLFFRHYLPEYNNYFSVTKGITYYSGNLSWYNSDQEIEINNDKFLSQLFPLNIGKRTFTIEENINKEIDGTIYTLKQIHNYHFKKDTLLSKIHLEDVINLNPINKKLLNSLLLKAIQEAQLNIDCSNTDSLIQQTKNTFAIGEKGLEFYFLNGWYYGQEMLNQIEKSPNVLIPYSKLMPILKNKSAVSEYLNTSKTNSY